MSLVNRAYIALLGISLVLIVYAVPEGYREPLVWAAITACIAAVIPIEQLVWRTRFLRRPYYAARRWLSRKTVRRWWHRLFGHGTVVITPPEASPLATFMGGVMICGCGKQLGFWDTERRWNGTV